MLRQGVDPLVARCEHVFEGLVSLLRAEGGAVGHILLVEQALVYDGALDRQEERALSPRRLKRVDVRIDGPLVHLEGAPQEDVLAHLAQPAHDGHELHGALREEGDANGFSSVAAPKRKQPVNARGVVAHHDRYRRPCARMHDHLPVLLVHADDRARERSGQQEGGHGEFEDRRRALAPRLEPDENADGQRENEQRERAEASHRRHREQRVRAHAPGEHSEHHSASTP
mmetsp:Transcript_23159/g.58792  ORF Transcript_23159/g.58792 Transcript_23159/m.58792 type:complete len:228 (+) Transcript_23159:883-1566(+)